MPSIPEELWYPNGISTEEEIDEIVGAKWLDEKSLTKLFDGEETEEEG